MISHINIDKINQMIYVYCPDIKPYVQAIIYELKKIGLPVKRCVDKKKIQKKDTVIVFSPYSLYTFRNYRVIFWNFDPIDVKRHRKVVKKHKNLYQHGVISFVSHHQRIFEKLGSRHFYYVPFGYSPKYEYLFQSFYQQCGVPEKDIDVLFYGSDQRYQEMRRAKMISFLKRNGIRVKWVGRKRGSYVLGTDLIKLIAQSKIVLSISHGKEGKTNDLSRLAVLLSSRNFVIADRNGDQAVEDKLAKYVIFFKNKHDLLSKCQYYLKNDEERRKVCEDCYLGFKEDFPLADSIPVKFIRNFHQKGIQ